MATLPSERVSGTDSHPSQWAQRGVDIAVVIVFLVVAFLTRRDGLPHHGLWHDDAWVATGAVRGRVSELLMVGSGHPGFTGILMGISRVTDGNSSALAYPAFVAGVAVPAVLYAALRWANYARSIAALLAAALVVADVPILYSGRVKTYAIDAVIVLLLTAILPLLTTRTWRWPLAVGWTVFAAAVGFFSGFALAAAAVAGVVLVLHPRGDLRIRVAAVGMQMLTHAAFYLAVQGQSDLARIEDHQESLYDGHVEFSWNPVEFFREALTHLRRVAEVYSDGPGWWLNVLVVAVLAGFILGANGRRRDDETLRARYAATVVLLAFVGALLGRFPFGPSPGNSPVSPGSRSTMWLVPLLAIGFAILLERIRDTASRRRFGRYAFDLVVAAVAVAVLVAGVDERAREYPFDGSREASRFIDAERGPNDLVLLPFISTYTYAVETGAGMRLLPTPDSMIGYFPEFHSARVVTLGKLDPAVMREVARDRAKDADRVFVPVAIPFLRGNALETVFTTLEQEGFVRGSLVPFDTAYVEVLERD